MHRQPTKALDLTHPTLSNNNGGEPVSRWLTILPREGAPSYHRLNLGLNLVGRGSSEDDGSDSSIQIHINDSSVSHCHAAIECLKDGTVFIEDKKSTNKTLVRNGPAATAGPVDLQPGRCYQITAGTQLAFGSVDAVLSFTDPQGGASSSSSSSSDDETQLEPTLPATIIEPTLPFENPPEPNPIEPITELAAEPPAAVAPAAPAMELDATLFEAGEVEGGGEATPPPVLSQDKKPEPAPECSEAPAAPAAESTSAEAPATESPATASALGRADSVPAPAASGRAAKLTAALKEGAAVADATSTSDAAGAAPSPATSRAAKAAAAKRGRAAAAAKTDAAEDDDEEAPKRVTRAAAKKQKTDAPAPSSSSSAAAKPSEFQWYFQSDLRFKETTAATTEGEGHLWSKYSPEENERIEKEFKRGRKTVKLNDTYSIDLKVMVQFRNEDRYKQRPVKREAVSD